MSSREAIMFFGSFIRVQFDDLMILDLSLESHLGYVFKLLEKGS